MQIMLWVERADLESSEDLVGARCLRQKRDLKFDKEALTIDGHPITSFYDQYTDEWVSTRSANKGWLFAILYEEPATCLV